MTKQLKANLGGQELTMDFGKFWFKKFFGEYTEKDPVLSSPTFVLNTGNQFKFVVALVAAGLNTFKKTNKDVNFYTVEEVEEWVGELEDEEVSRLVKFYTADEKDKEGEVTAQPEVSQPAGQI